MAKIHENLDQTKLSGKCTVNTVIVIKSYQFRCVYSWILTGYN